MASIRSIAAAGSVLLGPVLPVPVPRGPRLPLPALREPVLRVLWVGIVSAAVFFSLSANALGEAGAGAGPVTDRAISLNLYGANTWQAEPMDALTDGGLTLLGEFPSSFSLSFVVPTDHAPGTPIGVRLLWHSLESSCFVALTSNFISVARVGSTPQSDQFSINGGVPIFTPATPRETIETVTFFPGALALQQGDAVTFGIFRSGASPNDTCTENSFLRGVSVIYQGIQLFYDGFASADPSAWTSSVP